MAEVANVVTDSVGNTEENVPASNGSVKTEDQTAENEAPTDGAENSSKLDESVVEDGANTTNPLDTSEADPNTSKSKTRRDQRRRANARRRQNGNNGAVAGVKRPGTNLEDTPPIKKPLHESIPERVQYAPELKLTIVDGGGPSRRTIEFRNSIRLQEALEDAVFSGNTSFVPKFHGSGLINGVYKVTCFNMKSVEWLRMTVERLPPLWLGAKLMVIGKSDGSALRKVSVTLPGASIDPEVFLRRLAHQNPKLDTDTWKIFRIETKHRGQGYFLGIDEESLEVLKELDYKPFYGLTRLNVKLLTENEKAGNNQRGFSGRPGNNARAGGGRPGTGRVGGGGRRPF